jgi:imidazoleglycerol-phosphate dehydratase
MNKTMGRKARFSRKTRETDITLELDFDGPGEVSVETEVPFFDHLLEAMAFHGRFGLKLKARGDIEVDEHHLVEDTGIVLGEALKRLLEEHGPVRRFAQAGIPMDEALGEVVIDVSGRPYLVFTGTFPQQRIGTFQAILLREFLAGLANRGRMTIHAHLRYGENSHHMAEALFKALGVALSRAYAPAPSGGMSTKGTLE